MVADTLNDSLAKMAGGGPVGSSSQIVAEMQHIMEIHLPGTPHVMPSQRLDPHSTPPETPEVYSGPGKRQSADSEYHMKIGVGRRVRGQVWNPARLLLNPDKSLRRHGAAPTCTLRW